MTHVAEIALFTDDVEAVSAFYGDLTGAPPVEEWPGGPVFEVGGSKILVHERSATLEDGPPNEDRYALAVDDLGASYEALRAQRLDVLVEPRRLSVGRSAYLRDPDGRLVQLAQA